MIADLTGNIRRVCDGLATEIGKRVEAEQGLVMGEIAKVTARQVLLDWFIGDFIPNEKRGAPDDTSVA